MNPYVSASLAMCAIVFVSLAATAYLAVVFTRRAKRDLTAALTPLAEVIGGDVHLDDAYVKGRYAGHIVEGRMANASEGAGRVFQTVLVDPAGGTAWRVTSNPSRDPGRPPQQEFESEDVSVEDRLGVAWTDVLAKVADPGHERVRFDYDPAPGRLRLTRPMRSRRDIPTPEAFRQQLDVLVALGPRNRYAQGAPDGVPAQPVRVPSAEC